MSKNTKDTLMVPVKLVINKNSIRSGLEIINLEHYSDKEQFFKALECLLSKQTLIESLLVKYAWYEDETGVQRKVITSVYAVVDRSWDEVKFTEKRYRGKIKSLEDLKWLESKLNLMSIDEFNELIGELYPELLPTPIASSDSSLGYRIASKMNRF